MLSSFLGVFGLEQLATGVAVQRDIVAELAALGAPRDTVESLNVCRGTFSDALAQARDETKFVCVLLISPQHEDARAHASSLFSDDVCDILRREFVLWGASVHCRDGYDASSRLGAAQYPFLGVVYSYTPTKTVCLTRLEGRRSPELVSVWLRDCQDTAGTQLVALRADRHESQARRRLMEEQDEALRAAEEEDSRREAEEAAREEAEAAARRREEEAVRLAAADAARKAEEEMHVRLEKEARLAAQRAAAEGQLGSEPAEDEADLAKLRVMMLDGSAVDRRFRRSDTVASVAALVRLHPSYTGEKEFDISTTFPVKVCCFYPQWFSSRLNTCFAHNKTTQHTNRFCATMQPLNRKNSIPVPWSLQRQLSRLDSRHCLVFLFLLALSSLSLSVDDST